VVAQDDAEIRLFTPNQPREKWMKKRTSVKLKVRAHKKKIKVVVCVHQENTCDFFDFFDFFTCTLTFTVRSNDEM
jgi:hypothetical protein